MANSPVQSVQATHIGSLLRPPHLLAKRAEFQEGKCTAEELRKVEDEAIKDVVNMQRSLGLKEVTDGEYRRYAERALSRNTMEYYFNTVTVQVFLF